MNTKILRQHSCRIILCQERRSIKCRENREARLPFLQFSTRVPWFYPFTGFTISTDTTTTHREVSKQLMNRYTWLPSWCIRGHSHSHGGVGKAPWETKPRPEPKKPTNFRGSSKTMRNSHQNPSQKSTNWFQNHLPKMWQKERKVRRSRMGFFFLLSNSHAYYYYPTQRKEPPGTWQSQQKPTLKKDLGQ